VKGALPIRLRVQMPALQPDVLPAMPTSCPNRKRVCTGQTFHRYGQPHKNVRDVHVHQVRAQRWHCTTCRHTFRVYPTGVTRRQQSRRLQALSIFYWTLGMSLDGVSDALAALECPLGRSTVYANLTQAGTQARRRQREKLRAGLRDKVQVRVLAVDPTHVKEKGRDKVVMHAVDAQAGTTLEITTLPGEDEQTITRYVQRMAKLTGCEVLVSDDADTFKAAADAAGLAHQVCQQHVVPNTLTLLSEIAGQLDDLPAAQSGPQGITPEGALEDLAELEDIILARAPGSEPRLQELCLRYQGAPGPEKGKKADPWYRLHLLTLDLAEDWRRLTLTDRYRASDGTRLVPPTNNVTERDIGLNTKERYRTMRGYKSTASLRRVPVLTALLRHGAGTDCWRGLLAA